MMMSTPDGNSFFLITLFTCQNPSAPVLNATITLLFSLTREAGYDPFFLILSTAGVLYLSKILAILPKGIDVFYSIPIKIEFFSMN